MIRVVMLMDAGGNEPGGQQGPNPAGPLIGGRNSVPRAVRSRRVRALGDRNCNGRWIQPEVRPQVVSIITRMEA